MKADNIMLATILDLIKSVFGFFRYIKVGRKIDEQQIEINDLGKRILLNSKLIYFSYYQTMEV